MNTPTEELRQEVYHVVAAIPRGKVITYGQIAFLTGRPQNSRLVGHLLHGVPRELRLPCHRVVNASGRLVPGWSGQRALLEQEGVAFRPNGHVDLKASQWKFMETEALDISGPPTRS
ncbi:MGMT family protein [Prevotella sp. KH2C16]|uniref:MGMT family protein n=1 Tax=Prevotella sp. KH2C16 TaxID=1855325 RepID=UPI0008EF3E9C|nr:methylated-DNA--[protein]-cysteine S-methyltransferase [Prevotella sp. KH2C16]SFG21850.1 methylated-DNA-protein-cysteine methyltransferase related protein [Prevotella sp. KH2C16]